MTYDDLLIEADKLGLTAKEKPLIGYNGRIKGCKIAIRKDIPTLKEKACILAEEIGHFLTSSGNILNQNITENQKQEYKARLWAYDRQIGLIGIISAYNAGCRNIFEMAEHLDVTEDFLSEALESYRRKYGEYISVDNYIVYFEPNFGVLELYQQI
ncbi:hypothetical protein HNQ56_003780 [Anaerotaenia torta]|uniref:hypothetical protein n=1 Tax=Anaerotaenia torta TaxID=433293 RepID=UPI003D23C3DF